MNSRNGNLTGTQKALLTGAGLLVVLDISAVRYFTGPEFALSLFYLLPIILISWFVGFWPGALVAVVSALGWLVSDLFFLDTFSSAYVPFINEAFRLTVFFIIILLISSLKKRLAISHTDYLTGLANTRWFLELTELELRRARRYAHSITVVFLDLDGFKNVNNTLGHQVGDRVLRDTADCLLSVVRDTDVVARFGGDEFLILMPETAESSVQAAIDRLQLELAILLVGENCSLSFSAGVVTFNEPPEKANDLLRHADKLMYDAKSAGKNTIEYQVFGD